MTAIMNSQLNEFVKLLKSTICSDNIERKDAESRFENIDKEVKINLLMEVLKSCTDKEATEIACLLLRQCLHKLESASLISEITFNNLKTIIPQLCLEQVNDSTRHKLIDVLITLMYLHENSNIEWSDGINLVYSCITKSNNDIGIEVGLRVVGESPGILDKLNLNLWNDIFCVINRILENFGLFKDSLILDCTKAVCGVAVNMPLKKMKNLVGNSLKYVLNVVAQSDKDSLSTDIFEELSFIVEYKPQAFKESSLYLIQILIKILSTEKSSEGLRIEVMEFMATYSEHSKRVFLETDVKNLLPNIVNILIRHISLIPDNESWLSNFEEEEDEGMDISVTAETCLDRIACSIGGKTIFPIIMNEISPLFLSKVWQHRCACLITLSCIAEGCIKVLKPYLPRVVESVVPFIKDENPRVIFYTINTLGQLAVDYGGYFQTNFHSQVFPVIFFASEAYVNYPRVRSHAVCCYNNLLDTCPKKILDIYADEFFIRLRSMLLWCANSFNQAGSEFFMENVLVALSKLANCLDDKFTKFYPSIIQELIGLVQSFSKGDHFKLFISSVDAISSVLISVTSKVCYNELNTIVQILQNYEVRNLKSLKESSNLQLEYLELMSSLSEVMGDLFSNIVPSILPTLLEICDETLENHVISSSVHGMEKKSDKDELNLAFTAHTEMLEEKQKVCYVIEKICLTVPNSVVSYIEDIVKKMLKLLRDTFDCEIHTVIMSILSIVIGIAQKISQEGSIILWNEIFNFISSKIRNNKLTFNNDTFFNGLRKCLKVISYSGISDQILTEIMDLINIELLRILRKYSDRLPQPIQNQENVLNNDEDDESDFDTYSDDDDDPDISILGSISKLNKTLLKLIKDNYYDYFLRISNNVFASLNSSEDSFRCWGLNIVCDIIKYMPEKSVTLSPIFLPSLNNSLINTNPYDRQTAFYCIGIMAQSKNQSYFPVVSSSIPIIVKSINDVNSKKDEKNNVATANAIAAIGRIMKFTPQLISPFDQALEAWIAWLPVIDDEVPFILSYLIEIVKTNFPLISSNTTILYSVLTSIVIMVPYVDENITASTVDLLTHIKAHLPDPYNHWYNNLDLTLRENVDYAFQKP